MHNQPSESLPVDRPPTTSGVTASSATWRVVSRLLARDQKAAAQAAVRAGRMRELERIDLLAPEGLERLAVRSLGLLLISGVVFVGLDLASRFVHWAGPLLGSGPLWERGAALVFANIASYVAILPLHEGVHALVILALGGRPRFGLHLPLAAYCTAPDQLFTRNGYIAVALAPLLVLSALGAAVTWIAPDIGACILLGLAGNVAGAVGDLVATRRLRKLPADALIRDTEIGYVAVEIAASSEI